MYSTRPSQIFRLIFGLLAVVAVVRVFNADLDKYTTDNGRRLQQGADSSARKVYETAAKSVVYIDCFGSEDNAQEKRKLAKQVPRETAIDRIVGNALPKTVPLGSGSGSIWDNKDGKGIVVTNNHVVHGCTDVEISLLSKKDEKQENQKLYPTTLLGRDPTIGGADEYHWKVVKAEVVGTDPDSDIAVLRFDATNVDLTPIKKGDDQKMWTGDDCFAIGNPFGLDHTITKGIISAMRRVQIQEDGEPMTGLIQTDASINPGNSGGPLLNENGELIGMNTMIISKSGSSSGIGFAIPITTMKKISDVILKNGKVTRPQFGVKFGMEIQTYFGISEGALVYDVYGPATKAGLVPTVLNEDGSVDMGDIILKINNKPVQSDIDAYEVINECKPGQVVNLTVKRWVKDKFVEKKLRLKLD